MNWEEALLLYERYLKLERGYAANTALSYLRDIRKLKAYALEKQLGLSALQREHIDDFLYQLQQQSLSARSLARLISGLKNFFQFLLLDGILQTSPVDHLETPKISVSFPNFLTLEEIEQLLHSIDRSTLLGERNFAIIEMLYGCGLRVSELVNLKVGDIFPEENFVRVFGKGSKERLVPIADATVAVLQNYLLHVRPLFPIHEKHRDIVFLNRRGKKLTREMIFTIIKETSIIAGVDKKISPHTFRHSFATHMLQNGADLRSIQLMLGHENLSTTQVYTHSDMSLLRKTILQYHPRNAS